MADHFSIVKSRKPINNHSAEPSLLFFGRKIKAALVGIQAFIWYAHFLAEVLCPRLWYDPHQIDKAKKPH